MNRSWLVALKNTGLAVCLASLLFYTGCTYEQAGEGDGTEEQGSIPGAVADTADTERLSPIISMVPKSLDNPVFLDAKEEAERTCKKLGVKFEWLAPMQTDAREQENIVESLIRRNVDGIIISCIDPVGMGAVIDKAVEAGIKVATFDSDSPGSKRLFYCGTDNYEAGEACGRKLVQAMKSKNREKDSLKAFIMTGESSSDNLNERVKGFKEAAKEGGLKIDYVDTLNCLDDINRAGELLETYIRGNRSIDIFYSTGGWPLILPADSMPSFQQWCLNGGTCIAMDTFYPNLLAAKKGLAEALIGQDFKKMGELSVLNVYNAINGRVIPDKFIDTGLEIAEKGDFDRLLLTKVPWEIK